MTINTVIIAICALAYPSVALSNQPYELETQISSLFEEAKQINKVSERIAFFSERLLSLPYQDSPLGEGSEGTYDKDPLYRFDAFDCTTFVETVLALSLSSKIEDFASQINQIRYRQGQISFVTRNHFTSLDWIPNNKKSGILKDITRSIAFSKNAKATIRKRSWYLKLHQAELAAFLALGIHIRPIKSSLPYIPLERILHPSGTGNGAIIKKIPHGSIINVVRPNWDLRKSIGTRINVSHQGLAIWKQGKLYFRHASSHQGKIIDSPFVEQFKKYAKNPSIKGLNILVTTKN